jgi:phage terminase small subunit
MGKRKNHTGLTPAEEAFCVASARTGNARIAYEVMHPTSTAKPESKRVNGYKILQLTHIALRIARLRAVVAESSNTTVLVLLKELDEARELALEMEQPGVAVAATMNKARLAGLLKSGGETRRDVASVSIVFSAEDLSLGQLQGSAPTRGPGRSP